jgi:hypothetical protein
MDLEADGGDVSGHVGEPDSLSASNPPEVKQDFGAQIPTMSARQLAGFAQALEGT